jgi:hypothetical protein
LQCQADNELVLPLLDYINDKTLRLASYTLSIGHCNALARSCQQLDGKFTRVILDNCGVDDTEFSAIIEGIATMKDFKKIVYRHNVFSRNSLNKLRVLLHKPIPHHLEELRIENCKIESDVTRELIELLSEKSFVSKLGLVDAKL